MPARTLGNYHTSTRVCEALTRRDMSGGRDRIVRGWRPRFASTGTCGDRSWLKDARCTELGDPALPAGFTLDERPQTRWLHDWQAVGAG
jgi:hypothetical protein